MNKQFIASILPIIRDKQVWDAFVSILDYEEQKIVDKLKGPKPQEDLIRINAEYTLIQNMKKLRDNCINAELEFSKP